MCPAGAASGVIYYPRGDGRRHETEVKAGCDIGCTDLTEAKYEHAKRGGNAVIDVITNTDWTNAWTSYMIRMTYEQPEHGVHYRASRHGGWQSSVVDEFRTKQRRRLQRTGPRTCSHQA